MRVYISGPITGVANYKEMFRKAEEKLCRQGLLAYNPERIELASYATYEDYMAVDMALLDRCDAIYMLKGWEESRGANREYGYALAKGMKIMAQAETSICDGCFGAANNDCSICNRRKDG